MASDPFTTAYQMGLAAFIIALEQTEPGDETAFKPVLRAALRNFGVPASSLAMRLNVSKGTISKWINTDVMPSRTTREMVIHWMLSELHNQHAAIENN